MGTDAPVQSRPRPESQLPFWNKNTFREILYFGVIGVVQYIVDLAAFSVLVLSTGYPIPSNLTSRALGAICGYYLNGIITFRVLGRRRGSFGVRFVIAWLITTAASTGLIKSLSLLSAVAERPVLLVYGKAGVELLLFVAGFLLCKLWVFVPRGEPSRETATTDDETASGKSILFVLAHPDDEFFFAPRISEAVEAKDAVYCAYITDGAGRGVSPTVRSRESTKALGHLGVPAANLLFVGAEAGIRDGSAHVRLGEAYDALADAVRDLPLHEIYVLAWEGGHPDHDAIHLVGVALARTLGVTHVYECPGYSRDRVTLLPFRVMKLIPRPSETSTCRFGLAEGLFYFSLCACYRSQWRTWLGLGPEAFVRLVLGRRHEQRAATGIDYTARPHPGPLLYERRFGVSFTQFREATAEFISSHVLPSRPVSLTHVGG